jgi:sulfur-oxidizing protein SoxY
MESPFGPPQSRRRAIQLGIGGIALVALPNGAGATDNGLAAAMEELFGSAPLRDGRVALQLPKLVESGNSVPLEVRVESPMSEADHVSRIVVLAEKNPRPKIVEDFFSPASGEAFLETRIRLSGTQGVMAVAQMSDGSLWRARQEIEVIVGACKPPPART